MSEILAITTVEEKTQREWHNAVLELLCKGFILNNENWEEVESDAKQMGKLRKGELPLEKELVYKLFKDLELNLELALQLGILTKTQLEIVLTNAGYPIDYLPTLTKAGYTLHHAHRKLR